jgi:hypothetical protein
MGEIAYYAANGTAVNGNSLLTISGGQLTIGDAGTVGRLYVGDGGGNASIPFLSFPIGNTYIDAQGVALGDHAFGSGSLVGGAGNIGIGYQALYNDVGTQSIAIGYTALRTNTSGGPNLAIGYAALVLNDTGSNNIALGTMSLQQLAGGGSDNIAIGYDCLPNSTSGSQNIAIGTQVGNSELTSGSSNILIGYSVDTLAAGTSDYLNIGNVLYGINLYSTGTIGINNNNPNSAYALDVTGGIHSTTNAVVDGNTTSHHLIGGSSTPSHTLGTGAGTGASATVTGTDLAGQISVTTAGSPAAAATVITVTFANAYASAPYVVFSPVNLPAASTNNISVSSTSAHFVFTSTGILSSGQTYIYNYVVCQ